VQSEVLITNEEHLFRFIIPQKKIEDIKNYFELISQSFVRDEYEKLLDEVRIIQNLKEIYREGVEELLKYDYADISSNFYKNLKAKGYEFDEEEM
jgi:nuclear transport factor 2 (NTF2) superfamily protein